MEKRETSRIDSFDVCVLCYWLPFVTWIKIFRLVHRMSGNNFRVFIFDLTFKVESGTSGKLGTRPKVNDTLFYVVLSFRISLLITNKVSDHMLNPSWVVLVGQRRGTSWSTPSLR